jgi:hypothetical protein
MSRLKHLLVLGMVAASAAVPGVAAARDDDDVFAGDPPSAATIFNADGSSTTESAAYGTRAFVARLVREGAAGGSFVSEWSSGDQSGLSRSGFARPTTARYLRYKRVTRRVALSLITSRTFVDAEGDTVEERGWAVDIASGAVRRVSLDAARRLSLDPRAGKAGTEYVFQVHVRG